MPCLGKHKRLTGIISPQAASDSREEAAANLSSFSNVTFDQGTFFVLEEKNIIIVSQSLSQYIRRLGPHPHLRYHELT